MGKKLFGDISIHPMSDNRGECLLDGLSALDDGWVAVLENTGSFLVNKKEHILIVEDDKIHAQIFSDYLNADGFSTSVLDSGKHAVEVVKKTSPGLLLLDLMLPEKSGEAICEEIREFSTVPIIILTAKAGDDHCLEVLNAGADDYICKPARPKLVLARVNAVLRRANMQKETTGRSEIEFDRSLFKATFYGERLDLTPLEFRLLELFDSHRKKVFSREDIKTSIYQDNRFVSDRTIDSHVKNLRKKLTDIHTQHNPIKNVYGLGYKFELPE